jgi:eukaryotic-like serine/threonine-protein kinase
MHADPNPAKEIFLEAVERHAPDEWPAFLDRACPGQPDLRGRVEVLLAAHREVGTAGHGDGAEGDLRVATLNEPPIREGPGTLVGPYTLLEQIGEGGFGVVFVAEQARPVRRRVALKVLKPGMDTRQVVARFEAERQALALMDHPNIAQIYDGGTTPDGRPFFVMELVKGVPVTEYCDGCGLTPRERLELLRSVCQAVQHAHTKGVIHRDLKPSNVLVAIRDGKPAIKVIDFGIAKAIDQRLCEHTVETGFHQMVGTPLYMSPEQAELSPLDVDTRADIYALGVLLYELLTGTTPLEKARLSQAGYDELRRLIREDEPPRPSARLSTLQDGLTAVAAHRRTDPRRLVRAVRGELDWIVMKCLEKDRNRRYETANGLAQDLHRYLVNEPVEACPPSAGYRLRKFAQRHRVFLGAAAAVLVTVGVGSGAVWQQRQEAVRERARAEASSRQARHEVDRYYTRISENMLLYEPTLEPLRRQLLEDALQYYEDFARQDARDPDTLAELVAANLRITNMHYALGSPDAWLAPLERAVEAVEQLLRADARIPDSASLQNGILRPVAVALPTPHPEEAVRIVARYCAAWEELVRRQPTVPGYRNDLSVGHMVMMVLNLRRDEFAAVIASGRRTNELVGGLVAEHPDDPHYRYGLALNRMLEATALTGLGRPAAAEQTERESLELARGLMAESPALSVYQELFRWAAGIAARNCERRGRLPESEALRREAIRIDVGLSERYPTVPRYRTYVQMGYGFLGDVLWAQGRHEEAGKIYRQAVAAAGKAETPNQQDALAWLLATCPDRQIRDPERAVKLATRLAEEDPDDPTYLLTLGAAHYARGDYQGAARAVAQAAGIPSYGTFGEGSRILIKLYQTLAHARLGEVGRARAYYQAAVAELDRGRWWDTDYCRLCAEAEQVLGLPPHPDPWAGH